MTTRTLAGLLLLAALGILWALPARSVRLAVPAGVDAPLRGALHVHTAHSDGTGTADEVAAAAARAGLAFVIMTDHGDGTRVADRPEYRHGVLTIDAVEVSTYMGHVVALGLPQAPYPLAGEPLDVLEDVRRLGGMSIVAHPTSMKADLRWRDADAPFDGLEWLNGDSEWRDDGALALARVVLTYWFRGPESLASLLDRPTAALDLWDRAARSHSVVGVAGSDAHARIGGDEAQGRGSVHIPSYEQVFRTLSISLLGVRLSGDPAVDADAVIAAVRAGHLFSTIDGLASPGNLVFTGSRAGATLIAGDRLPGAGPVVLRADVQGPAGVALTLYENGLPVATSTDGRLEFSTTGAPGAYRVEATLRMEPGQAPVPWLVSNPIYVGDAPVPAAAAAVPVRASLPLYEGGPASWTVEHSARATGAIDVVGALNGSQLSLRYALGGSRSDAPFVAFVVPAGSRVAEFDRLTFSARARRPMRISVQLRARPEHGGGRWRRSVYLDDTQREFVLPFEAFSSTTSGLAPQPAADQVGSVLFVIDTVNTALGTSGEFWIDDVTYAR